VRLPSTSTSAGASSRRPIPAAPRRLTARRLALRARPEDATAAFNLGVALEDLGRDLDAIDAYEEATALDPGHADAYFNLAGVCERVGRPAAAIRHLKAYRSLLRSPTE